MKKLLFVSGFLLFYCSTLAFTAQAIAADRVTIVVWDFKYGDVANIQPAMKAIDQLIMQKNPGITIDHIGQPDANYYQLVTAAVQANEGPDVVMFHGLGHLFDFQDSLVNLDGYIKPWRSEIDEAAWKACAMDKDLSKGVRMVPLTSQGTGIYYNKVLFKKAGLDPNKPPTDPASFLNACEKLKKAGIVPLLWGSAEFTADQMLNAFEVNTFGKDAATLLKAKDAIKNSKALKDSLLFLLDLVNKGYVNADYTTQPYFFDTANTFSAGKGGMILGLLSDVCHWKAYCDALGNDTVGYFPVINFPGMKMKDQQYGYGGGIGYAIMNYSKQKDAAMKVIEGYARGDGVATWMRMTGALAPTKTVDAKKLGYPLLGEILKRPMIDVFTAQLTTEEKDPVTRALTQLIVSKEISVDQYLSVLQNAYDAHMKNNVN
jgi:raffinose/stachyose/melibiose transport system substrate-binding protein